MKLKSSSVSASVLVVAAGLARADIYTLEMDATVGLFFDGTFAADEYPFAGLNVGDPFHFHFEYDIDALPTRIDKSGVTYYSFNDGNSYAQLGSDAVNFDQIVVTLGTNNRGDSFIDFLGVTEDHNYFIAGLRLESSAPMSTDLPTSVNLNDFDVRREAWADNGLNGLFFPLVGAAVNSITVTPAPAGTFALLIGAGLTARRRRA